MTTLDIKLSISDEILNLLKQESEQRNVSIIIMQNGYIN